MTKLFKRHLSKSVGAALGMATAGFAGAAMAAQPEPWQMGMQAAATSVMDDVRWFNDFTLIIVSAITLFVLGLIIYCVVRFNKRANPTASRTSHNTMIEVVWTVVPILILVVISVPSFRLLFKQLDVPEYEMTVKATGYQWYWGYEYMDEGMEDVYFDSIMLTDEQRRERMQAMGLTERDVPRLLAADYNMVVPEDTNVRVLVTAADVIHSFAMPAFGVKIDAVPGRLNETWFNAREPGMYYGQCSELCGKDHAFMPIAIQVVTAEQYAAWSEAAKTDLDEANTMLASMIEEEKRKTAMVDDATELAVAAR